jgi:hypothetical protein
MQLPSFKSALWTLAIAFAAIYLSNKVAFIKNVVG